MKLRALAIVVAAAAGTFPVVAPETACAGPSGSAVLVVDTEEPGGQYRYCVALPDESVSGIELIQLAGDQHGLEYRLGYGGQAVCELAGVGASSDDCFDRYPYFWGYWRGDEGGGWSWSQQGAGATSVENGEVEGWSWGTGNDGSTHPPPPETTFGSVCETPASKPPAATRNDAGAGDRGRSRGGRPAPAGAASPAQEDDRSETGPTPDGTKPRRPDRGRDRAKRRPAPGSDSRAELAQEGSPGGAVAPTPTPTDASADRPPVAGLVALIIAMGWIVVAAVITRRRKRELQR